MVVESQGEEESWWRLRLRFNGVVGVRVFKLGPRLAEGNTSVSTEVTTFTSTTTSTSEWLCSSTYPMKSFHISCNILLSLTIWHWFRW